MGLTIKKHGYLYGGGVYLHINFPDEMIISQLHWDVFRLKMQDFRTWPEIAEELGIDIPRARELHLALKAAHPDLYPCMSERHNFNSQHMDRYSTLLPLSNINEEDIIAKF